MPFFNETASLPPFSWPAPDEGHVGCLAGFDVTEHLAFSGTAGSVTFDIELDCQAFVFVNGQVRSDVLGDTTYWQDLAAALAAVLPTPEDER